MDVFTPRQKKLLAIGRSKGYIDWKDLLRQYTHERHAKQVLKRLCALGFFKATETGDRYVYCKTMDNQTLEIFMDR